MEAIWVAAEMRATQLRAFRDCSEGNATGWFAKSALTLAAFRQLDRNLDFFETAAIMKAAYIEQPGPADSIHYGELPLASVPYARQINAWLAAGKLKATIHCTLHLSRNRGSPPDAGRRRTAWQDRFDCPYVSTSPTSGRENGHGVRRTEPENGSPAQVRVFRHAQQEPRASQPQRRIRFR